MVSVSVNQKHILKKKRTKTKILDLDAHSEEIGHPDFPKTRCYFHANTGETWTTATGSFRKAVTFSRVTSAI